MREILFLLNKTYFYLTYHSNDALFILLGLIMRAALFFYPILDSTCIHITLPKKRINKIIHAFLVVIPFSSLASLYV